MAEPTKLFCIHLLFLFFFFAVEAQHLAKSELGVLRTISKKLGKTNWDFNVDPCSGEGNWTVPDRAKGFESTVVCDSPTGAANNSERHVVIMWLKGENLSGGLPPEFSQLLHLQQLDLSRSVINGTVPSEWSTMSNLFNLSLMGNRLSGPFPEALLNITTLKILSIESNQFTGPIPSRIGNLVNLENLVVSANEFTGELPLSLAKLTNLTELRICSNNFSGKIPDLIMNFTHLNKLHIQGSSLEGPIPSSISKLTNLTDLRITDLRGNGSVLPDLSGMKSLKTMMLRNCSIHGEMPPYIGNMNKLKFLDLSYNKLTGKIPSSFYRLQKADFIYLTGNMLTGGVPNWITKRTKITDLSYNNFTWDSNTLPQCPRGSVNMVESYFPTKNIPDTCLKKNFPCSNQANQHTLNINCGGGSVKVNGTSYEQDVEPKGASTLFLTPNWAFSSTGNFMDNDIETDDYIVTNSSLLAMPNSELYTKARLSAISLTYYGLCMINGDYTVKLHFAEIIFTNDISTFTSLGKRLFNVYIQGKLVLEDFNIAVAAGGEGKAIIKTFTTSIKDNTLEILFYWAGKGTTGIPNRGNYGPLISAISVKPNFDPPSTSSSTNKSKKIHVAIISATSVLVLVIILSSIICWTKRRQEHNSIYKDLRSLDMQTGSFTLRQIKAATRNFDTANKIGEGGFGSVYKGLLSDGIIIAVKQLSSKSKQGNREFVNEIGMISALQHPNLVKLYGCCIEGNQLLLIYEYMENNCLARALFGRDLQCGLKLDWPTRRKICLGIARGLTYLHEESRLRIVHRDIKASNVLLDKDLNAKISDFGLAKLNEEEHSHISTRVAGTIGYMAPEYAMRGHLTDKADVYSFGVVTLEIVSGKSNTNYRPKEEFVYLLDWAQVLQEKGTLLELVDPELGSEYSDEEAKQMLTVALLCTNSSPTLRPSMSKVVSVLEGKTPLQPLLPSLNFSANGSTHSGVRRNFWQNPSESQTMSIDASDNESSGHASGQEHDATTLPFRASEISITSYS